MADISKITTLDGTTYNLKDSVARAGISGNYYGVCSTAGGIQGKEVSISGITELTAGLSINVKFTNRNTSSAPTLNVNSLGAKGIYLNDSTTAGNDSDTTGWENGAIVQLTYDGEKWIRDQGFNTYVDWPTMTLSEATTGSVSVPRVITPDTFANGVKYWVRQYSGVNFFSVANISSLPVTITSDVISQDSYVIYSKLTDPTAQADDWTITTQEGSLTISGTVTNDKWTHLNFILLRVS